MKVLFVVPSLANAGPVRVVQQLTDVLARRGVSCEVWYFDKAPEGLKFCCATKRIGWRGRRDVSRYDVIHTHGIRPDAWLFEQRLFGCKCASVSTLHNYVDVDLRHQYGVIVSRICAPVWRFLWRAQTQLVVLTEDAQKYYSRWIREERLSVVSNGIAPYEAGEVLQEDLDALSQLRRNHYLLGACARVTTRKGLDQIVRVLQRDARLGFVLVGDGRELCALKKLAARCDVRARCLFLGFRENARDFVRYFDCFVMPSRSEGHSIALLEAAAAGCPLVLSNISAFSDVIPPDCASFFSLEDLDSLEDALGRVEREGSCLARRLRGVYESEFTAEVMATRYLTCYNELISGKQTRA